MGSKLKAVLIRGTDSDDSVAKHYASKNQSDYIIIGNGAKGFTLEDLDVLKGRIDENTKITIDTHGNAISYLAFNRHAIRQNHDAIHGAISTNKLFNKLNSVSDGNPLHVHLWACYGGLAAKDVNYLPKGSVLVAHASKDLPSSIPTSTFAMTSLPPYSDTPESPYAAFAHDIALNSMDTSSISISEGSLLAPALDAISPTVSLISGLAIGGGITSKIASNIGYYAGALAGHVLDFAFKSTTTSSTLSSFGLKTGKIIGGVIGALIGGVTGPYITWHPTSEIALKIESLFHDNHSFEVAPLLKDVIEKPRETLLKIHSEYTEFFANLRETNPDFASKYSEQLPSLPKYTNEEITNFKAGYFMHKIMNAPDEVADFLNSKQLDDRDISEIINKHLYTTKPLAVALDEDNPRAVYALLKHGASEVFNNGDKSPILYAACYDKPKSVAAMVCYYGITIKDVSSHYSDYTSCGLYHRTSLISTNVAFQNPDNCDHYL